MAGAPSATFEAAEQRSAWEDGREIESSKKGRCSDEFTTRVDSDDLDQIMIQRLVYFKKGKWNRFTPEFEKAYNENTAKKQS